MKTIKYAIFILLALKTSFLIAQQSQYEVVISISTSSSSCTVPSLSSPYSLVLDDTIDIKAPGLGLPGSILYYSGTLSKKPKKLKFAGTYNCGGARSVNQTFDITSVQIDCGSIRFNFTDGITRVNVMIGTSLFRPRGSAPGQYCEDQKITLYTTFGYTNYRWQVSEDNNNWTTFSSGSYSVTVGLQDIFGVNYRTKFGKPLYFQVSNVECVGRTPKTSLTAGSFTFYPSAPNQATITTLPPSCPNGNDGIINITNIKYPDGTSFAGGSTLTYTLTNPTRTTVYNIQSSSTNLQLTNSTIAQNESTGQVETMNIRPGDWELMIENADGRCGSPILTINVPNKGTFSMSSPTLTHILCNGEATGAIKIDLINGSAPFMYELYQGSTLINSNNNNSNSCSFTGLQAGSYVVKVKDNCFASGLSSQLTTSTITLNSPSKLQMFPTPSNILCKGNNTGKIEILATGGVQPYSYSKDNGTTWQSGSLFSSLSSGTYIIKVKDLNNCTTIESVTISEPAASLGFVQAPVITNADCRGLFGSAYVKASGGTIISVSKPYKFFITGRNDTINDTEALFSGIPAGNYFINVKDRNNCIYNQSIIISEPNLISLNPTLTHTICKGDENGKAKFSINGGTPPYTVEWRNSSSELLKSETVNSPYQTELNNLKSGTYKLRIKDANNCTNGSVGWFEYNFTIQDPEKLVLSTSVLSNIRCKGESNGAITLAASGGWNQNPYQYSTDNITFNTIKTFNNLSTGNYTYFVKDNRGCIDDTTLTISEPSISFSSSIENTKMVSCKGGNDAEIDINATGGWVPYYTSINGGNTWNETTFIENLTQGNYTIQVKDNGGCTQQFNVTITEPTQALSINLLTVNNSSCGEPNGSAIVNAAGGTSPYSFIWKNNLNSVVGGDSARATGLLSGTYSSEVTDHNGCTARVNNINISDIEAPEVSIVNIVGVNCPGELTGSATLEIVSGIQPVTIEWPDGQIGLNALNLPGEILDVVIKDGNGCKVFFPVSIPTPAPFQFDISKQLPNCKGECNGAISVNVTGGTSPYNYSWDGNSINVPSLTDICPNTYKLNILDQRNCEYSEEIVLPDQAPLTANLQDTVTLCVGQQIELNAGNPGASYTWTRNGILISNDVSITTSTAGQYVLLLQDLKGCQGRDTLELITSTSFLQADFLMTSNAVVGDTIVLFEISSPAPQSIHWTFDANALVYNNAGDIQQIIFSNPGTYQIKLEATLAECYDDVIKYVTIYETQEDLEEANPLGFKEASLISFIAYPNPNSGDFQTTIELSEEQDIELRMANLITSEVVFEKKETGKTKYDFQINQLNPIPGFYVLSLKAGDKYKTLKILVQ